MTADRTDARPLDRREAFAQGLAQWPVFALFGLFNLVLLGRVYFELVLPAQLPIGQKSAILFFVVFAVASEMIVLTLANAALQSFVRGRSLRETADAARALGLALWAVLLLASYLKLRTTGTHLQALELRFLAGNLGQLTGEALGSEREAALLLAGFGLLTSIGTWVLLRQRRRKARPAQAGATALLALLCLVGAGYTYKTYDTVELFARRFVAEFYWLSEQATALPVETMARGPREPALGTAITNYNPPLLDAPNVVLVMLESIPWKRTTFGGGRAGSMPNLEALAAESVIFTRPYTTSTHSDYAQMAVLSSLHPRKFDRHDFYTELTYPRTLIWDALEPAGYVTSMFSAQNENWGNMIDYLSTPGLGLMRHSPDWPEAEHRGRGDETKVWSETPVAAWREWRHQVPDEPFFTYFNFQENHFPYGVPRSAPKPFAPWEMDFPASFIRYPKDQVPVMLNRFYNALRYADEQLGAIVTELEARGEWDRTIFVVVSDHGEAFYEHAQPTHGTALYEEQIRSFLLMRVPGVAPRIVETPVSLLDVAPTLLRMLGLPDHGNFQGRGDILDASYDGNRRPLFLTIQGLTSEDGVLIGPWKYIVNWGARERVVFQLQDDPREQSNLIQAAPDRAAWLEAQLAEFLARQRDYYSNQRWEQGYYPPPLP